jgi:HAMP domain-containing protein
VAVLVSAVQAFAATLAACILLDRSALFAWRRLTQPLPRIVTDPTPREDTDA